MPLPGLAQTFPTRVAADVSRRHLRCEENAPTDVGGYTPSVNRAKCETLRLGKHFDSQRVARMRGASFLAASCLAWLALQLPAHAAAAAPSAPRPGVGIALLASDIGHDYSVTNLVELIEKGGFAPVIIDWAWVTFHWERTDFKSVRELVTRLRQKKVEVAAMYRPRFLGAPSVPEQVAADGQPAFSHGHYPCYSSPAARQWATRWGTMILEQCPGFEELILYNPLDLCQCPACRQAKRESPHDPVWTFLAEAKRTWRQKKPTFKLGVVYNPQPDFWARGREIADSARPFLSVLDNADLNSNAAAILEVQRLLGNKPAASLAKVTWGPEDRLSLNTLSELQRISQAKRIPYVLWTFDSLFLSAAYAPDKVAAALGLDYQSLESPLRSLRKAAAISDSSPSPAGEKALPPNAGSPPPLPFPALESTTEKLPWPHQAPDLSQSERDELNRQVWVINNHPLYQADERGDWCYFHGGLDIVLTNGTKIYAIKDGWVKALVRSSVIVADAPGKQPGYGWSYAHLGSFRVREGEFVKRGTVLGEVNFHGLPHTHLEKVFSQEPYWGSWAYVHFTFLDDEAPTIQTPFHFFENNSDNQIAPQPDGSLAVRGDIDIVVAMRDGGEFAHSKDGGFGDRVGVTRIEYTICPVGRKGEARHFQSFDFRKLRFKTGAELSARSYTPRLARIVYKHYALFGVPLTGNRNLSYYIISNCPGDNAPAELDSSFANCCWQTVARGPHGAPLFPDGDYLIEVTAFDSHENKSTQSMRVTVDNAGKLPLAFVAR